MKVGSLSFGLPVSDSAVSNKIFEIKATKHKTNISTPMLQKRPILWFSVCKRISKNQRWWFRWVTGNIISSYREKTDEKTVIEDVEYGIDKLPGSYDSNAAVRVFDKIENGKAGVLI